MQNNTFNHNGVLGGKVVSTIDEATMEKVVEKEAWRVKVGSHPDAVVGVELTEFKDKESGELSHGFIKIMILEGGVTFAVLKELISESPLLTKARNDSATLYVRQLGDKTQEEAVFQPKLVDSPIGPDRWWMAAICKITKAAAFTGIPEPTNQYFLISKRTALVKFIKPIYLNNFIQLMGLELEREWVPEDTQFIQMEVKQ